MIPRQVYFDNLQIAALVTADPRLCGLSIVECGTWRGGMSAGLIEVLGDDRIYHFFDSFSGLPAAKAIDGAAALQWQANKSSPSYLNNCAATEDEFRSTVRQTGIKPRHCKIHKGWFEETVEKSDTGPIALLRLDGDWYDSTMCCLTALFPRVAPGGIVIIDDYGTWDGCTRAVHDYLAAHRRPEAIRRFGASGVPYLQIQDNRDVPDERHPIPFQSKPAFA